MWQRNKVGIEGTDKQVTPIRILKLLVRKEVLQAEETARAKTQR